MSTPEPALQYVAGGTVQAGEGVYVERTADETLLNLCRAGEFAYVLTSRQMGKSSLMIHTAEKLIDEGVKAAIIDLTGLGANTTPDQWYRGFLEKVTEQLELQIQVAVWWDGRQHLSIAQRFNDFFVAVVLHQMKERIVIFVDEIDTTLRLDFRDDFFASIRYLYNGRSHQQQLFRLSFVLLGVASPTDLIKDPARTPFNIGRRVDLQDFTEEKAALHLRARPDLVRAVFQYTGGHPYLTLRVFRSLAEQPLIGDLGSRIEALFLGQEASKDSNLVFVRDMLAKAPHREGLLLRYRDMLKGKQVPDQEADPVCTWLKLSGIAKSEAGSLQVRNLIYRRVFDLQWVRKNRIINWPKRLARVALIAVALLVVVAAILLPFALVQRKAAETRRIEAESARALALLEEKKATEAAHVAQKERDMARRFQLDSEVARSDAEKQRLIAFNRELAARSDALQTDLQVDLEPAALLATEAMERLPSFEADRALRPPLLLMPRDIARFPHPQPVNALTLSPDARYLATAARDLVVRLFEISSGKLVRQLFPGEYTINLLFSDDGRFLLTANDRGLVRVLDVATWQEIARVTDNNKVVVLDMSHDGRYFAVAGADVVRVFSTSTAQEIGRVTYNGGIGRIAFSPDGRIGRIAFSPDGRYLAASNNSILRILDIGAAKEISVAITLAGTDTRMAFTADSRELIAANSQIHVIDVGTGQEKNQVSEKFGGVLAFSPDVTHLAVTSYNSGGDTLPWSVLGLTPRSIAPFTSPRGVRSAEFSPDGLFIAVTDIDRTARVFEISTEDEVTRVTHPAELLALHWSRDGRFIVTLSDDNVVRVFEPNGQPALRLHRRASALAFSPDGNLFAMGTPDYNFVCLYVAVNGKDVGCLPTGDPVYSVAFSSDGKYLAAGTQHGTAMVFDLSTQKEIVRSIPNSTVYAVAFSLDPNYFATGSDNGVALFSVKTGKEILKIPLKKVVALAFSPNGSLLATGSEDSIARVFSVSTGEELFHAKHNNAVNTVSFSPNGQYLATGDDENTARIFEIKNGKEVSRLTHQDSVLTAVFSRDSKYLATGSLDGTARVFEVLTGRRVAQITLPHEVDAVRFSEDQRYLGTVTAYEHELIIYKNLLRPDDLINYACSRLTRNLTTAEWREQVGPEVPYHKTCPNLP